MSWLLNQIEDEFTLAETLLRMHYEIDVPKFYNVVRLQPDKARFTYRTCTRNTKCLSWTRVLIFMSTGSWTRTLSVYSSPTVMNSLY